MRSVTAVKPRKCLRRRRRGFKLSTKMLLRYLGWWRLLSRLLSTSPYVYWGRCDRCKRFDRLRCLVKKRFLTAFKAIARKVRAVLAVYSYRLKEWIFIDLGDLTKQKYLEDKVIRITDQSKWKP